MPTPEELQRLDSAIAEAERARQERIEREARLKAVCDQLTKELDRFLVVVRDEGINPDDLDGEVARAVALAESELGSEGESNAAWDADLDAAERELSEA